MQLFSCGPKTAMGAPVSSTDIGEALLQSAVAVLRPLVRRMLAHGVTFGRLESCLRELFVRVAEEAEFAPRGRSQTDSHIAILTGINRKEVRRIRAANAQAPGRTSFRRNLAAGLISRWTTEARTAAGRPLPLPYRSKRGPSFVSLARKVTSDLAPRALLDALVAAGAAEARDDGTVVLTKDTYSPRRGRPETWAMVADDPKELVETMLFNVLGEGDAARLQQKLAYDNLGSEALPALRQALRREADRFLKRANALLARSDRDRNRRAPGGERTYAGIGVYYFEGAPPGSPLTSSGKRRSRNGGK